MPCEKLQPGTRVHIVGLPGITGTVGENNERPWGWSYKISFDRTLPNTGGWAWVEGPALVEIGKEPPKEEGGHPDYLALLDQMRALHVKKSADYGLGADMFANVRAGIEFGVPAWVGTMIRANDKMVRIKAFIQKGKLENESVEDSLMDLAAYALIALVLYREDAAKKEKSGGSGG